MSIGERGSLSQPASGKSSCLYGFMPRRYFLVPHDAVLAASAASLVGKIFMSGHYFLTVREPA